MSSASAVGSGPDYVGPHFDYWKDFSSVEGDNAQVSAHSDDEDELMDFIDVLTASYVPHPIDVSPLHPSNAKGKQIFFPDPRIQWERANTMDDSDSDDECSNSMTSDGFPAQFLDKSLYSPHGPWAWASGLSIMNPKALLDIGAGAMCSATLKTGFLGSRRVMYISRCWELKKRLRWRGFYSELALYKSQYYLKSLQGLVIPSIIGVHVDGRSVSLAMEPPHHSFWIEASPDMPDILKEIVVEGLEKIHAKGVLHGDIELRHILIGGDCRVTFIDFQESRSLRPYPDVMLGKADRPEFEMEMRMLKYKIDYKGAQGKEEAKMARAMEREGRNAQRRNAEERRYAQGPYAHIAPHLLREKYRPQIVEDEQPIEEDVLEPPPHPQDWRERWIRCRSAPRRTVVPGQTAAEVETAVAHFLDKLRRMQDLYNSNPTLSRTDVHSPGSIAVPMRKRRASETSEPEGRSKRRRLEKPSDDVADDPEPAAQVTVSWEVLSTSSINCATGDLLPASNNSSDPPKPPRVRDFATAPYEGPRGFYVPHPPTDNRLSIERAFHIRQENSTQCRKEGLPYYTKDAVMVKPASLHRYLKRGEHISMGALKRKHDDPSWMSNGDRMKKRHREKQGDRGADAEEDMVVVEANKVLDLGRRSKTSKKRSPSSRPTSVNARRGILRNTPTIKTISYAKGDWQEEADLEFSPKLGPRPLLVSKTEARPILGAVVSDLLPCARVYPDEEDSPNEGDDVARPPTSDVSLELAHTTLGLPSHFSSDGTHASGSGSARSESNEVSHQAITVPSCSPPPCTLGTTSSSVPPRIRSRATCPQSAVDRAPIDHLRRRSLSPRKTVAGCTPEEEASDSEEDERVVEAMLLGGEEDRL
ncbi:hypothetical protein SCP_0111500 [Sparassis crispa]|uniref:Protein kinase domain-containing protein n=1 Tax=Sparassis crispa TaxID=139825 RepID=A0A401G7Y3_9APHY|nr:hypothetical protein SCP_0111500 [Sparassis crispa]GBE78267.1 hypothetical protein SCP_0111500 [Sparassis crispa]